MTMIAAFVFFLVGVVGTMIVAQVHYSRAAEELKREAEDLRRYSTLMVGAMKRAGWVKLKHDREGNISGLEINSDIALPAYSNLGDTRLLEPGKKT